MINSTNDVDYSINKWGWLPTTSKSWFANKATTQNTISNKFYKKHYTKQNMNKVSYPVKIMPKHVAIYSEQVIHSDNT